MGKALAKKQRQKRAERPKIFTIGHSNRTAEEFTELLAAHNVKRLADIRTVPRSGFNPHFNGDALAQTLAEAGIEYVAMPALGGFRSAFADSPNTGWRTLGFRGYADYMVTAEFKKGLKELEKFARRKRTVIMCAEAVPWRCHRSLVSDALIREGWAVYDIMGSGKPKRRKRTPFMRIRKGRITYPPPPQSETIAIL